MRAYDARVSEWFVSKALSRAIGFAIAAVVVVVASCATAPTPDQPDGDGPDAGLSVITDAGTEPDPDAMPPDAAPVQVTLSQTTSDMIIATGSVACQNSTGTAENSWYRVFDLDVLGIATTFTTEKVSVGLEVVDGNGGTVAVDVKLHTLNGSFVRANLTQVSETTQAIAEAAAMTVVDFPIAADVPGASKLVLEVHVPDLDGTGTGVVIGANDLGQSEQAYIRAPAEGCNFVEPVTTAATGFPNAHIVMSVTGSH